MDVEDKRRWYIKQANDDIKDHEYNDFLEKNKIKDLDNINKWDDEKFNKFITYLTEIMNDGVTAKNDLNTAIEEDNMFLLYDKIRNGVIALLDGKTAQASRTKGFGSGWGFRRKFFKVDETRVKRIREKKTKKKQELELKYFHQLLK